MDLWNAVLIVRHIAYVTYVVADILPLPVIQAWQQRVAALCTEAAGSGSDDIPTQQIWSRGGTRRNCRERSRRKGKAVALTYIDSYCKSTNFGGYKIWCLSKYSDLAAIKFGISPSMQCTINVTYVCWRRQILAKTSNSPNIIARQNLLIYSTHLLLDTLNFVDHNITVASLQCVQTSGRLKWVYSVVHPDKSMPMPEEC